MSLTDKQKRSSNAQMHRGENLGLRPRHHIRKGANERQVQTIREMNGSKSEHKDETDLQSKTGNKVNRRHGKEPTKPRKQTRKQRMHAMTENHFAPVRASSVSSISLHPTRSLSLIFNDCSPSPSQNWSRRSFGALLKAYWTVLIIWSIKSIKVNML